MKKTVLILLVFIVVLAAAGIWYNSLSRDYAVTEVYTQTDDVSPDAETSEEKVMAPDFTVLDIDGNEVSLSDFSGKPLVLNFWATWCGPCRSEFPAYEDAYREFGEDAAFVMINLTDGQQDTVDSVKTFVSDNGYTFPVYFDTSLDAAMSYGAFSIPLSVFVDTDGAVVAAHRGAMTKDTLYAYIDAIL